MQRSLSSKLCRQKCSCNVSLSEFGPRSASSLQNWNCLSAPAPDRQRTASDAACAHAWMTEIVHPQNRRATKDWTHFQNSTWGASCVQRRGKGRELAAFPFCGPAKYLLLLQWGTTYRARIKGGPQVAMVGRKFTKLGARLSAGSVQRGYDRYHDNPVKWTAVYGLRRRVIGDLKAVEQKDRPTAFLSTKKNIHCQRLPSRCLKWRRRPRDPLFLFRTSIYLGRYSCDVHLGRGLHGNDVRKGWMGRWMKLILEPEIMLGLNMVW